MLAVISSRKNRSADFADRICFFLDRHFSTELSDVSLNHGSSSARTTASSQSGRTHGGIS